MKKGIYEGSEIGSDIGRLLELKRGNDDETGPSIRLRVNVWNKCLRSGVGGMIGGVLGKYFVSALGSKLVVSEG